MFLDIVSVLLYKTCSDVIVVLDCVSMVYDLLFMIRAT